MCFCMFAFVLYGFGYIHKFNDPVPPSKLFLAPRWLFYLCAKPKRKLYPGYVMSVYGAFLQMAGIFLLSYGIILDRFVIDENFSNFIGFLGSLILAYFLAFCFYWKWPYRNK